MTKNNADIVQETADYKGQLADVTPWPVEVSLLREIAAQTFRVAQLLEQVNERLDRLHK